MRLFYFAEEAYNDLYDHIESNRERYAETQSWISKYFEGKQYALETNIEYPDFELVFTGDKAKDDYENTVLVYNSLGSILTPHQACNKYMWSLLAHEKYWDYVTKRWPVENGSAIKTRYFCGDSRNALSLNALSRLWWYGRLTFDGDNPIDPYHHTQLMISDADLCQNLIQHKYSMEKSIILGILDAVDEHLGNNKKWNKDIQREMVKYINRYGAVASLDVFDRAEIKCIVQQWLECNAL
jgi:hypothetical protein